MKKVCASCQEEKNLTDFRKDKSRKDGYQPHCKLCARSRGKNDYATKHRDSVKKRDDAKRAANQALLLDYKNVHPCIKCGEAEPCCIDFHHLDPDEKEFGIAGSLHRKWETILTELEKCIPLCANCHRKVHGGVIEV